MSKTLSRCRAVGALAVGAMFLLGIASWIGCTQQAPPAKPVAAAAPAEAPVAPAVQPAAAAAPAEKSTPAVVAPARAPVAPAVSPSAAAATTEADVPMVAAPSRPATPAADRPAPTAPVAASVAPRVAADASAKAGDDTMKVGACDGGPAVEVDKKLNGQALADSLMDHWKRSHPEAKWVAEEKERHAIKPPADNSDLLKGAQGKGHTYGNYTERDILTWAHETEKFVAQGSRLFHSADELNSSVAVSCDMCHPHAANTHPETYPKYQVQLGKVVLLRDMINWCIENPVRGRKLAPDDPAMRALEAYIQSQRKGVPMNYGKH